MTERIKSHRANKGRHKNQWMPCEATKRSCPISSDMYHMYFSNIESMETYNQIESEFPEFSRKSVLISDVLGSAEGDSMPLGGDTFRLSRIWGVKNNLSECEQAAAFGADVSKVMGMQCGSDDARDMQSILWDSQAGGLTTRKSGGSVIKSAFEGSRFGDINLGDGWEKKFEIGQSNPLKPSTPKVTAYVVGNGHTLAAIRQHYSNEGKPQYDVRLTTRDHPQSSMELMLDGDDNGSITLDGDEYGTTLDRAVDAFEKEAPGMCKHDVSIRIDRYWIQTYYQDDFGGLSPYSFDNVKALSEYHPNTALALDGLKDDIPYGKNEPGTEYEDV